MIANLMSVVVDVDRKPQVEVIICSFNGERYIAEQLESIFNQSRLPDLISIYDDGSTDRTLKIIDEVIERCAPLSIEFSIVQNEKNLGYVENFSKGIKSAKGDVLFFCDQDDRWDTKKIETLLNLLTLSNADLVFSDGGLINSDGVAILGRSVLAHYGLSSNDVSNFSSDAVVRLVRRNYINGAAMAVRRTVAATSMPVPHGLPHDYWLAIWCSLHGGIAASPKMLYEYRQHSSNVIGIGLNKWYYVWYGVLRSPLTPRLIEHSRYLELVPRIASLQNAEDFVEKLHWLDSCVGQKRRMQRFWAIFASSVSGNYWRFGGVNSWMRDLVAVFTNAKR